jgi:hypothetical protein
MWEPVRRKIDLRHTTQTKYSRNDFSQCDGRNKHLLMVLLFQEGPLNQRNQALHRYRSNESETQQETRKQ